MNNKMKNRKKSNSRYVSKEEQTVLDAWKRGERTHQQVAEITGFTLDVINKYLPVFKDDERMVRKTW